MYTESVSKDFDSILSERCSNIIVDFRNNNIYYKALCDKLDTLREELLLKADKKFHYDIKNLVWLHLTKSYYEQLYMYIQGMKDCNELSFRLEEVFINRNLATFDYDVDNIDIEL